MSFSPFEVLCFCAAVALAPLMLALGASGPRRHPSNRLLLGLLGVNGLLLTRAVLMLRGYLAPGETPYLFLGGAALFFALPPLVYLYAVHVLRPTRSLRTREAWHGLPAVLAFCALSAVYVVRRTDDPAPFPMDRTTFAGYLLVLHGLFSGYAVAAVRAVTAARKAPADSQRLRWGIGVLALFGGHWAFSGTAGGLSLTTVSDDVILTLEALSIVTLLLFSGAATLLGIRHLPLFAAPLPSPRYAGSAFAPAALRHQVERLETHLRDAKPYLDPALSAEQLADALGLTPRQLSHVLSDGLGSRFFDVINRYRVEEAQRLLRDPERAEATILELLYEAGFNSKSAFNRAFKQATGLTPSAYRLRTLDEPIEVA